MDHEMNRKRKHMYLNKQDREHYTHQKKRSRESSHTCETIFVFIFIYYIFFIHDSILFLFLTGFFSFFRLIFMFIYVIMYRIHASCVHLMYETLFICFFIYFVVYSNHSNCNIAHGVGVHT